MSSDFLHRSAQSPQSRVKRVEVKRYRDEAASCAEDAVAVEEPLEIRLGYDLRGRPAQKSLSVTMRTPGHDRELAAGFLFSESLIERAEDVARFELVADSDVEATASNVLRVHLAAHVEVELGSLQRHFYTTSSCGVCGKASIEALEVKNCQVLEPSDDMLDAAIVAGLPKKLRQAQRVFADTGGLHAAGLFELDGELVELREDVGRHNAMDKLVGSQLIGGHVPLDSSVVVWSGRASFELVQKAVRAQVPIIVAVGAPSSLAVELADQFGLTLVGFTRNGRFNVYTHHRRIEL